MSEAADSFGSYGRREPLAPSERAARAFDRAVIWAIALALALSAALAGYSLWDSYHVMKGTDFSAYSPAEGDGSAFAGFLDSYPDAIAWLTVPNTNIDHPVVQGKDNFEYLDKDAAGNPSASGSIFLDSACDPGFGEPYEVIMGHHMRGGGMFGDLDEFMDQDFFQNNQTAALYLRDRTLDLRVDAIMTADAYDGTIFSTPAVSQERLEEVEQKVCASAVHVRDGAFRDAVQVVALSTCSSSGATARTVLLCSVVGERGAEVGASCDY